FHGMRNGVWTYFKNMPSGLLVLTLPVWVLGSLALLARGLLRGVFMPTLSGYAAALGGLGPILATRRDLRSRRRIKPGDLIAALTWNPLRYLGRKIDVRP